MGFTAELSVWGWWCVCVRADGDLYCPVWHAGLLFSSKTYCRKDCTAGNFPQSQQVSWSESWCKVQQSTWISSIHTATGEKTGRGRGGWRQAKKKKKKKWMNRKKRRRRTRKTKTSDLACATEDLFNFNRAWKAWKGGLKRTHLFTKKGRINTSIVTLALSPAYTDSNEANHGLKYHDRL